MLNLEQKAHGLATKRFASVYERHLKHKKTETFNAHEEYNRLFNKYLHILQIRKAIID